MHKFAVTAILAGALVVPAGAVAKNDDGATKSATKACKAERDAIGSDAFREKYGSNKNGRNALGKCVSRTKRNAARACRAEREADPVAFAAAYGEGKNAFGKCVSRTARA